VVVHHLHHLKKVIFLEALQVLGKLVHVNLRLLLVLPAGRHDLICLYPFVWPLLLLLGRFIPALLPVLITWYWT